jgi:hypothetical protein
LGFSLSNNGYLMVGLSARGGHRKLNVHALVAQAFLGERPSGFVVHHIDADKSNNHAFNLAYVSRRQNIELGALVCGESHCQAKLKDQDIPEIRHLAKQGWNSTLIGKMFGVSSGTIWSVINGKTWKHISYRLRRR